ncbi:YdcF family protein [Paenibacillus sp. CGMCC 1.16610]|uniref:YdcF family protein n=1 Tax=Paenibacillus anseongense TaxID=2682845 RepID=A0ABW9TZE9_9BACL|nr:MULTISPECIES: YdcF family protein [Paenibacillus]MBA2936887.1 YdcF family protein [Paenibacillus sp. CGMCC 1.16610]MVQ33214.1 YdcF family protein [Paenibacillus anseongense]
MFLSELDPQALDKKMINRIIFEDMDDDGQNADFVLVFGSITAPRVRVPKAVALYKAGRATTIIMSGGTSKIPEAHVMRDTAIQSGVKESDIWVEDKSTNTKENVINTRELIDELFGLRKTRRILLVTNYFHLRRCYLTMKTFMPDWIEYSLCGVLDSNTRPDNWWTNEKGQIRVLNEIERLIKYTKANEIVDYNIN